MHLKSPKRKFKTHLKCQKKKKFEIFFYRSENKNLKTQKIVVLLINFFCILTFILIHGHIIIIEFI